MSKTADGPSSARLTLQRFDQLLHFTCLIVLFSILSPHSLQALPTSNPGWTASNIDAAFDPVNRRGRNPLDRPPARGVHIPTLRKSSNALQDAAGAGSSNFQMTVPVVNLPGRGIGVALALTYNSRLWTTAGTDILFDVDADWPAPGWSLGFGKLLDVGAQSMLVDADGTRHPFKGAYDSVTQTFTGHTTDGTLIDYWRQLTGPSGQVKYPNGTVVDFTAPGQFAVYPTRITDANGNYIAIQYVNNTGPQIAQIIDTLGRIVVFNYDSNGLLTAIIGPDLNGGTRTILRLHYRTLDLHPVIDHGFSADQIIVVNPQPWLVDAIYDPATGAGYWFGDPDSFSAYGMVAKVIKQRAMGFTAGSLTAQGTVTPGTMTRQQVYDFPLTVGSALTDSPAYTTMTETWDSMDTQPSVTQYKVQQQTTPRRLDVVQPDGTHHIQLSYYAPKQWNDGLVYSDQIQDVAGTILQQTTVNWVNDTYGPHRTSVQVTDERQQVTATGFIYGPAYNQVTDVQEYDYGGTQVLRTVHTDYGAPSSYAARHIFNLPTGVSIYRGTVASGICEARTDYTYDGQPMANTPAVVNHADASNPFAPRVWVPNCSRQCDTTVKPPLCQMVCNGGQWQTPYQPATDLRGNVTQITRYTDACGGSGPITETRRYDIAGNRLTASSVPYTEERFDYTATTQYAYPTAHVRGSPQSAKTHIASDEFSGVQGYQQWSYLDSYNAQLTYDNTTGVWKSANDNVALIPQGGSRMIALMQYAAGPLPLAGVCT